MQYDPRWSEPRLVDRWRHEHTSRHAARSDGLGETGPAQNRTAAFGLGGFHRLRARLTPAEKTLHPPQHSRELSLNFDLDRGPHVVIKLYGFERSRWVRPLWTLRELKLECEAIEITRHALKQPPLSELSPLGKAPILVDGDLTLVESMAIVVYLADRYAPGQLAPLGGTAERALHDQVLFMVVTEVEAPLWRLHRMRFRRNEENDEAPHLEAALSLCLDHIEQRVESGFVFGDAFSIADILTAHLLTWKAAEPFVTSRPNLGRYVSEMISRDSFPSHLY